MPTGLRGGGGESLTSCLLGVLRPVGAGATFILGLEGCGLGLARGGLLELGVATQVIEALAGVVLHVHALDVRGREGVLCGRAFAGDAGSEGADSAQDHLVALQDELAHAHGELGEDADDGALGEHTVVLGDVLGQLVGVDDTGLLQVGIRLLGFLGMGGILHHPYAVLDFLHLGNSPSLTLPRRERTRTGVGV